MRCHAQKVCRVAAALAIGLGLAVVVAGCDKQQTKKANESATPTNTPAPDQTVKVVNVRCPIMTGNAIDPAKVPANLTRTFKGRKVGFCCAGCPPQWDKLSDADKEAHLAAVLPPTE